MNEQTQQKGGVRKPRETRLGDDAERAMIRAYYSGSGWTIKTLAADAGVSQTTVKKIFKRPRYRQLVEGLKAKRAGITS